MAAQADKGADGNLRGAITKKYPAARIVAWCGGRSLALPGEAVAALRDGARYRVVWAGKKGALRELESLPASQIAGEFELQCLSPREAKERKQVLRESETIRDAFRVPAGKGAFCYFINETETRCWSFDRKGNPVDAGGWQT